MRSILFVVRDPLPPIRADVRTLFGTEMPRYGVATALVGQGGSGDSSPWPAGGMHEDRRHQAEIVGRQGHGGRWSRRTARRFHTAKMGIMKASLPCRNHKSTRSRGLFR